MTTPARPCPDDLTDRRHRAQGSELEQRALVAHLNQCESCRVAVTLAEMFDAVSGTSPDDDQIVARLADRAAKVIRPFVRRSRTRRFAIAAGLALLCGATGAAAWALLHRETPAGHSPTGPFGHETLPRAQRPAKGTAALREAPISDPVAGSALAPPPPTLQTTPTPPKASTTTFAAPAAPARAGPRRRAQTVPDPATVAAPTPETLFAEANAVRRAGALRRAVALYRGLQQQFPRSAEARASSVFLGDLLLGLGDLEPAVAAFDSYLTQPRGELAEEALFGRGRALTRLGRGARELDTWTELMRRFPQSAYRPFAAKRIEELRANPGVR